MRADHPGSPAATGYWRLLLLAVIVAGILLRVAAARGDLWLDEIWSLAMAKLAGSPAGVFTALHSDNNHYLNTLWLLAVGPEAGAMAVRGLALLAGSATLIVAVFNPLHFNRSTIGLWLALLAGSPLLVQYSSEARGYAPAAFFALAAFLSFNRFLTTRRQSWLAVFAVACGLGLLAHLTFVCVLAAFAAWGIMAYKGRPARRAGMVMAAAFVPPALLLVLLWAVDLRHLVAGGGMAWQAGEVFRELLRTALGLPRGPLELLGLLLALGAVREVAGLARAQRPEWAFFVTALIVAPPLLLALPQSFFFAPRYFAVGVPFFLMLVALALSRLARQAGRGRWLAALMAATLLTGGVWQDARLALVGRGNYRAAVEFMVNNSPPGAITVGSDNEFRNPMLVYYYAARLPGGKRISCRSLVAAPAAPPDWFIRHDFAAAPRAEAEFSGAQGERYRLAGEFPYAGLSGWHWQLYRRSDLH